MIESCTRFILVKGIIGLCNFHVVKSKSIPLYDRFGKIYLAQLLLQRIQEGNGHFIPQTRVLDAELIVRNSTRKY